jgi:O-antigen biosynthesis protein
MGKMMFKDNSDNIELSISIVNYNTTDRVLDLLQSIYTNLKNVDYEILIVDNSSNDDPSRILLNYKDVKLILNPINQYFTKADNQNFVRAKGQFILSINPDTLVRPYAIENMIDFLKKHKEAGAVTPRFIYPDGKEQASIAPFLSLKNSLVEASGLNKLFPKNKMKLLNASGMVFYDPEITQEAEVLYGACIMIRREVLEGVGLKDEKFVHGWDEYDWCMRIKKGGWKLFYIHDSVIVHHRSESIKNIKNDSLKTKKVDKHGRDGYFYLHYKHFGFGAYILLRIIWALNSSISRFRRLFYHSNRII